MSFVSTPQERFKDLTDYPFQANYVSIDGMNMHYVDEGQGDPVLLLHGEPSWSYLYRHMIPLLVEKGFRAIAPDLIGFGKSDKPTEKTAYTYSNHQRWLTAFVQELDLKHITLFCQDWGGLLGLRILATHPDWFKASVASNTFLPTGNEPFPESFFRWRDYVANSESFDIGQVLQKGTFRDLHTDEVNAYNAPFPSEDYKVGSRQFPQLVPTEATDPEGAKNQEIWARLAKLEIPFLTVFGEDDPITRGAEKFFIGLIPGAKNQKHLVLKQAGHFIQEDQPEALVDAITQVSGVK